MPYKKSKADYIVKPDRYKHKKPKSKNPWSRNYDDSPKEETSYFSQPQDYSQGYVNPYVQTQHVPLFDTPSVQDNQNNLQEFMDRNKPANSWRRQKAQPQYKSFSDKEKCCCEPETSEFNLGPDWELPHSKTGLSKQKGNFDDFIAERPWEKRAAEARRLGERIMGLKEGSISNDNFAVIAKKGIQLKMKIGETIGVVAVKRKEGLVMNPQINANPNITSETKALVTYFCKSYKEADKYLRKSPQAATILDFLEEQEIDPSVSVQYISGSGGFYTGRLSGTSWNSALWMVLDNLTQVHCPAMILFHELYHQYSDLQNTDKKDENDNPITIWQQNKEKTRNDSFGNDDEYNTTMFVNKVISEANHDDINNPVFLDGLRSAYSIKGLFRIWDSLANREVTSSFDIITNPKKRKRAYYLEPEWVKKGDCDSIVGLFEDDSKAITKATCINIPDTLKKIGL